ncbi:hypothetical protein ASA1KI_18800 [Opitutales bacterium ASA1]|uniref:hypothetical protein n=1 Tax=Congregicoccus parvus TaxID=3081749 RepID=UPI002B322639|nr:hypothetical protein ASA1KI_18800 [Opitutales bacterium ASA1]
MLRLHVLAAFVLAAVTSVHASDGDASPSAVETPNPEEGTLQRLWKWSDTRVRGIFEAILPDTQERKTLRLSVQPHFSDLLREDHVRFPVGLIYGFNRRTEGEFEVEPYFANPFKDGEDAGVANLRLSFKRRWTPSIDQTVDAAAGFVVVRPIPGSPYELTDGVNRYSVFTTFARPSPTIPNLEAFLNLSYDVLVPSSAEGEIREYEPKDDFARIVLGGLYKRNALTYGLSLGWAHTFDGEETNFVTVTPSVVYDVPSRFTFNSRGQWQIGAAIAARRYGDETDIDLRVRVRWRIDFKKEWREWRDQRSRTGED